jgi:sigma-E factor negative regulatory protein RseC
MIEQQGQAVSESSGRVRVRLGGQSGCAACDAGRGCGAGVFGKLLRRRALDLDFENRVGARRGQGVIVGIPEALLLGLVVRFYLFPLLAGLAGAGLGHYVGVRLGAGTGGSDASALLLGLAAGALVSWRNRDRRVEFPRGSAVHLLRVVDPTEPETDKRYLP